MSRVDSERRVSELRVSELWVHPVKSCAAVRVPEVDLEEAGPVGDRRWMWVDEAGRFVSQRGHPALARVQVAHEGEGLLLSAPGVAPLQVSAPPPDAPVVQVEVWGQTCPAVDAGDAAGRWLAEALGISARLVRQRGARNMADRGAPGTVVSFADGYPALIASAASIAEVARRTGRRPDARRFRPNLVIGGATAFAEDTWERVQIGDAVLKNVKPCTRCSVLDVDPDRGERDHGVLASLRPDRHIDGDLRFGVNALVERPGRVAVGDPVRVLTTLS